MSPSYTWLFMLNGILHGLATAVILVVVWLGWRRHRHLGFFLLVVWAIVVLFNTFGQWFLPAIMQNLLLKAGAPGSNNYILVMLPSILAQWVSTLFLLGGLGLLVFRWPFKTPADPANASL